MAIEKTFGSVPGKKLGDKDALGDIERFERGEPNPDETNGRRTETSSQKIPAPAPDLVVEGDGRIVKNPDNSKVAGTEQSSKIADTIPQEITSSSEKSSLKVPKSRDEVRALLDPNNTGEVTTERAKEAADALQQSISESNFLVRNAAKYELEGVSSKEAKENIEKRLGLKLESLETAKVIQNAVVAGANQEPLVARESGRDGKAPHDEQSKFEGRLNPKMYRAIDLNGDGTFSIDEAKLIAKKGKEIVGRLNPEDKKLVREGFSNGSEAFFTDEKISGLAGGLKVEKGAADVLKNGMREGLDITDGKSGGKKNWLEALLDIIKPLLVALGFMEDEPKKETAVAANNPPASEKSADGKGQAQQTQLTPEEKTKSLEYLAKLDESIQRDIKHAASQATGVGTVYAGKESGSELQVQTVSSSQQQPAQKSASL